MELQENGLRITDMNFAFSDNAPLFFKDVSFYCAPGKIHFLQGKNGSGKSTLFRILQGTIDFNEQLTGTFSLDNEEVSASNNKLNAGFTEHIKTVVQQVDEMIAGQFSVEQNLQCARLPAYPGLRRLPAAKELSVMRDFGIDKAKQADQLSGGQRQILAILMTLQKPAKLLLLDEPTAALDPKNAHMVIECLQELAQELDLTILIISHDQELITTHASESYLEIKRDASGTRRIQLKSIINESL